MRRWLWEQFNVRRDRSLRPPQLAVRLWTGDPIEAARSLRQCLITLVRTGQCERTDAAAWAKVASLQGKRTAKRVVAAQRGTGERGLHNRLLRVDAQLAELINTAGLPSTSSPLHPVDVVVQALVESGQARVHGRVDEADGLYQVAAEWAAVLPGRPWGRDRTKRARARHQARAGLALRAGQLAMPLDLGPRQPDQVLVVSPYELSDEPRRAVDELRRAWQDQAREVVPILLAHAALVVGDDHVGGLDARLYVLEIGSNILRDSESLLTVPWSTAWLRTAQLHLPSTDLQLIKARRTRAHALQLHGFLDLAGLELDAARHAIGTAHAEEEYLEAELVDLLLRRTSVDVADNPRDHRQSRDRILEAFDHNPNQGLLPGLLRNQVQLASHHDAMHRRRRTFGGTRSTDYEKALGELMTVLSRSEPAARITMWDTIIASATRLGDTDTIRQAATAITQLPRVVAVNIVHRLQGRLEVAARLPGLHDLHDIKLRIPHDPLRRPELLPQHLDHLV